MTRHGFFRILLSLLLLLSQQMAFAHALSHVAGVLTPAGLTSTTVSTTASITDSTAATGAVTIEAALETAAQDRELSSAIAQEKSCHQCLTLAQLAGPLGATPRAFAAPDLCDVAPGVARTDVHCLRTVCAFRSRAPPKA